MIRVKNSEPLPVDVIKTTQSFIGKTPSYNEAWRALKDKKINDKQYEKRSYELLIPYLEQFLINNPNSCIDYALDEEKCIKYCFLCHGSMNAKLQHVRPVMSIDATFIKDGDKPNCTLYIGTVLSANNDLVPVAFALTRENENFEGWKMFLNNLKRSCPILGVRHKNNTYRAFGFFTFVSDRDKGIIATNHNIH